MYFNRKNAEQKNWRMIKKGKHFLFGCSLVFAVGAALVAPTVKADTADTGEVETKTANSAAEASSSDEVGTYKAPAVEVSTTSPVVAEHPTSSEATSAKTAKEADGVQLPSLTVVADSSALTDEEKANVVAAVKGVNPTATDVQVQADGSVVVTFADGSTANLTASQTVKVAAPAETSATQPKSRSRRAAGQERAQDRSSEEKDIKYVYKDRTATVNDGDPTQRAKIEYRQLGDYEVVDGKTVATDPSGQGRPVLEWTVTFNEAQYDKMGGYYYFTIPKNVSDPYKVVTEYNNGAYGPRDGWVDGNVTPGGSPSAEGQQFIDAGNKLEWRVKNTVGGDYNNVNGLSGVMNNTKKVYVLSYGNNTKARMVTIKYRTVVEDPSQTISYIAGVESKTGLPRNNWYAISGKYDKQLVSQVAAPSVTPNLTNTSVNVPVQTVASTSSTLSGTGVPGATIKIYIDGQEQNIGNVTVDSSGNWTTGELPTALNNNQGDGTTIKPRQTVEVSQVVNGEESSRRTVPVSVGVTTVEPSSLTTNQAAVVAGQKEVTLKVPHDAGIAYMRYTNTAGETVEIPVKRDNASSAWTSQKSDKATVKSVEHGKFQDTIVLTMADKIAGTEVAAISNVVEGGFSSVADWQPRSVENQAPTIASAVEGNKKTVAQGAQLDLASLVTVADKEDDAQATLGDKVHAEVVSVNGDTATKTVDTNTQGTYTVKYKAVDSQGKESNEIEVTVVVNPARDNVAPTVEIPYSDPAPNKKEVYLYTGEDADVDITFSDDSGKIKSASLKKGGNIALNNIDGNPDKQDNEYGYTVTAINSETATPAKIKVTGRVSGLEDRLPKTENDSLELVTRYATATDTDGAEISNNATKTKKNGEVVGSYLTDPGAVTFVLKAQTKKYDIKTPASADKVTVSDASNVTDKEFEKIKEKVKVEYSQNNPDARLADKKGQEVEDASKVVDKVEKEGNNLVVTYKDGSKDTKPLTDFARTNVAPTVEIPYSDPAPNKKEVYLYTGEEADVDITFNDDSGKIKSASLKKGGNIALNNIDGNPDKQDNEYGYTVTAINSETATPAKIKVTGQVSGISAEKLPKTENDSLDLVTRFATATDTDGAEISNNATKTKNNGEVVGTYLTDPGAVTFVLKAQTKKYDIKTPSEADKVTVSDANNVTDKEFEKIKEKVKVEYSQNNPDARLADKKGQEVEDASKVVDKVEKDGNKVVVTYKDGSKDTKPLSEFVNVAPKVEVPYSNEAKKEIYVYTGENTDLTFKASDNTAVKDMYVRGPGGIGKDNTADYGFTTGKIENSAVTHGDGTVSGPTATIKMTGVTTLKAPNHWTSFVVANDNDNAPSNTDFNALDKNPNATQTPGYVHFIVKSQTDKYDIATPAPADKVEVADPTKVTDAELDKIKEKLKLEYNKNNDDANIAKNTPVDKDGKIKSVTNDGKGNLVVTYTDGSTDTKPLSEFVTQKPSTPDTPDTTAPAKPVIDTDLTGKAGTKTPVEVTAEPGSKVELFDKDGKKIGEGVADDKGKATITPTTEIPEGGVTAKATDKAGNVSEPSDAAKATTPSTPDTPDTTAPAKPVIDTDLTGKAGTKTPVEVTAEPGSKVELFDKDGKKIGEGVADDKGKATITPTTEIPEGGVTAKATDKAGNVSEPSDAAKATTPSTPDTPDTTAPAKPVIDTDLTGKAGTKTPVEVTAEPGSKVELFDKDGKKIGEGVADDKGKATITPTTEIPEGGVTAKATDKAGNVSEPSEPAKATTASTPDTTDTTAPAKPVIDTDLTGKAGTKTPVEVTAEPGSTVELFDKDGKKIGEGVADDKGKATITPTTEIPEGGVTAKATDKAGNVSEPSEPAKATTASTPDTPDTEAPAKPVIDTDLTGKAGTKTPVEVTAEPGSTVELFDKDGKKIGEGVADDKGKATITPTTEIPEGGVTAKATDKAGNVSEPSEPAKATTASTPDTPDTEAPAKPVIDTDLTGKAGTKTPVEVTAEPGSTVELFDKDGKKIGEGVADDKGKATITPTTEIPEGGVTAKATDKAGNVSEPSEPAKATTASTPDTPDTEAPAKPVIDTDLTGKAGTKTPVEVTAEPGSTVELFDKDGKKIGEGVADDKGKATITPTTEIPEGGVTAKATDKAGNVSEPSDAAKATTPSTPDTPDTTAPAKPVIDTDLTGKAGTKTPVEVTAEPGSTVELFDKDGKKIGEGVADDKGKATITPTTEIPEGGVTAKATDKAGNVSEPSDAAKATTPSTPDTPDTTAPAKPVIDTDLTGKAGTKTPVEVTAEPGSTVELFDKDGKKIGEGVADDKGKATITPTTEIPEGGVTAKATDKAGNVSEPSDVAKATTPSKDADGVKDPAKTPVKDPANLTDAEKAKVADEVKKANPTAKDVEVGKDGTATVTFPDGSTAEIPAAKAVEKAKDATPAKDADGVKDPAKTPVKDPANLTDAEKAKVADEVKKANPTAKDVEVGKDGTATVTFPDGSTAEIPAAKAVEKSADKAVKDPSVTPVTDPSNLTDAEKAKVADEVKKSNPTAKDVEVGKDGTTTVTYPDGTTAVIPADKTVKKSADKAVKDPSVTPVTDPSNLTDAEKAKVADEVKKSNPTVTDVKVGKDGTTTVTYPDGTTAVIPADKTVKKSADKAVKDPSVTPVTDPSNLTDAEKAKVADEVKKSNPTVTDVKVGKDGTTTVTYPDGTTAVIPADKTVKKSDDKAVKDPSVTPVTDPSNLTDAEKAKVADEVKKSNPTVTDVKVGKDGTTTVTYPDGSTAVIPSGDTVKKSSDNAVKDPSVTPVTDPSNLTDAEKAKVADEVKKSNPTVTDVKVGKDGTTTVTYPDGTTAVIPADKAVKKSDDKAVKDPSVTPVTDPSNLTDAEKAKVADEVKKSNPTVTDVKVGKDGTTTVTYPDGTTAVIPADKAVKKSDDKAVKDPSVTPVTDPSNLTDAEKAKVADEVKKSNPTVTDVKVGKDGTTTVTYPDGTTAVIPADKAVKKSDDKAVKDPSVTPVTDPSNLTDAEKAKVADEVKKSNPTVTDVKVGKDGTTTVTYPDGTTAVIPADKAVKKSSDEGTKDPSVTPVTDPSNLTDAEKAKVADEVKKSNPTVTDVKVGKDGTTTVTYPDGTTAVIPADKAVKKSADKAVKDPSVTPVTDPSNLTDAEKAKVADEVKKSNPTVTDVKVGKDGTTTVTYPDGTTAVIPADKTAKKSADKAVKDPSVTPVTDPSNLTDAEKAKVADEVKKSNPTVTDVKVGKDGTTTVTYPDGTTAVIPADKAVKKSADKVVKDPSVTPVTDPSNLTDAEKAKIADEVKKSNPTVTDVKVGKDGTTTVTYPDGTTAVIPADKTVKKSADKEVKDPSVTPVTDPSNLTDAEKGKVADEVKKSNPTAKDIKVNKDGSVIVTFEDGTTAFIPADKTVKKSADKVVKDPSVTPVTDPSNLTDAEKAKIADEVKKSNPTVTDVKVGKDGTTTVTYPDGTTAVIPADKTVKKSADKVVKDPSVTPVTDPSNLTDAEKGKVADEVKKSNPTAKDIKVNKDGSVIVTFEDGTTAFIPADKTVKKSDGSVAGNPAANQDSPAQAPAKKAGAKELPNTGTEQSSASLALALLAAATGGLLFAKKREEEE